MSAKPITYAEFGHNFIRYVVTADRIRGEIESVLKALIEGSVRKFPADLLVASYRFQLRDIEVKPDPRQVATVGFLMELTGDMKLDVKFINLRFRFTLDVGINLRLDVETFAPLIIKIVPHPITSADVRTEIDGHNLPSEVLEQLRIVGPIVREEIVSEVNVRIAAPELVAATEIDVLQIAANAQLAPIELSPAAAPLATVEGGEVDPSACVVQTG